MKKDFDALGDYEVVSFEEVNVMSGTRKGRQIQLVFSDCNDKGADLTIILYKGNAEWLIKALKAAILLKETRD